ncbi:hypothetical protein MSG28_009175 [Choristoneura fumiferana]|uniref:Uncharacterized protein n=1 Tax=Choristoneura fumiferana TaxID=7141 RepID=A0ACC0KX29_CHOFU|nr:hypothetical protein MSG28_009175 [Choristoneura fumiferana]
MYSINKATNNLVITLGFDFISYNGYAYFKFYRRGREPTVTSDYARVRIDPELLTTFTLFATNLQINQQEAFLTEGNFIAPTFIQYNICDFGLKVL